MFKELEKDKNSVLEEKRMKSFLDNKIMDKSIEQGKDYFVFYDGPATANGMPGIHHMLAKLLKDCFCKYKRKLYTSNEHFLLQKNVRLLGRRTLKIDVIFLRLSFTAAIDI